MKRLRQSWLFSLQVVVLIVFSTTSAQAARGISGSPEFGYGAILYPDGVHLDEALVMAADLNLDWVAIPLDWGAVQPDPDLPARTNALDPLLKTAEEKGISILISVSNAPQWALTPLGPDPDMTARFISGLAQHYHGAIQAVELFPGANTFRAWQGQVSPQAYYQVFQSVRGRLEQDGSTLLLVAGGLEPLSAIPPKCDMQDLVFLQGLYSLGAASSIAVISLQFSNVTGEPFQIASDQEARVLRRYEDVRRLMLENHHETGQIWITRFRPPSGKINIQDSEYLTENAQAVWLSSAYLILRSHLYIGVVFLPSLNSRGEGTAEEVPGLVRNDGTLHPFYSVLREIISLNQAAGNMPGRAKEGNFAKKRPWL